MFLNLLNGGILRLFINNKTDFVRLKAEVLVDGIRSNDLVDSLYGRQNPGNVKRGGYSGGLFFDIVTPDGIVLPVNAAFTESFTKDSPFTIGEQAGNFILYKDGESITRILLPPNAEWYSLVTSNGRPMFKVAQQHSKNQLATMESLPYCEFFGKEEQCTFCVVGDRIPRTENRKPRLLEERLDDLAETVIAALEFNPEYGIVINGGATYQSDRGLSSFVKTAIKLREVSSTMPISVECFPPTDISGLASLKDAGATSVMMNLETFDASARERLYPAKARLASVDDYLSALAYAVKVFGQGNVVSCLIAGTESPESSIEGARKILATGASPSILPGIRANTKDRGYLSVDDYVLIVKSIEGMKSPDIAMGNCINCGRCSLEGDYYRQKQAKPQR